MPAVGQQVPFWPESVTVRPLPAAAARSPAVLGCIAMRRPSLGVLHERDFRLLFTGHVISLLGDAMTPVALAFAILDLTGSAADLGYVIAARSAPLVGFLLIGGVLADRLPRRLVMVGADLSRFCTQGATAALLISGHARIWEIAALQAFHGAATAFFNPAATGLTPQLVSAERLQDANGLRALARASSGVAGPALAAALVTGVGPGWALAADAATFAASAACLAQLRLPLHVRLPAQSFVRDLLDGWVEFTSRTWVWVIVICAALGNGLSAFFFVLGAVISKAQLGGAGAWALILAAFSAGNFIGGLAVLRFRPRRPLLVGCSLLVPLAGPSALLAIPVPAVAIAAASLIAGAGLMVFNSLWETTLQRVVPPAALSRVSAYDWFGSLLMQPLGYALVGPAVGAFGPSTTLWIAVAGLFASCVAMLAVPSVRNLSSEPMTRPDEPVRTPSASRTPPGA
jgi:Transmembrane secretion effector